MNKSIVGIGAIVAGSALVYRNYKKYYEKYNMDSYFQFNKMEPGEELPF